VLAVKSSLSLGLSYQGVLRRLALDGHRYNSCRIKERKKKVASKAKKGRVTLQKRVD